VRNEVFDRCFGLADLYEGVRGGLVFKAHRLCVSLNSRLESNKEEEAVRGGRRSTALLSPFGREREFFIDNLLVRIHYHRDD